MPHPYPERRARMVLVDPGGRMLGQLPPIPVAVPFWAEVESVVRAVRARYGVGVAVVRLLAVQDGGVMRGGLVTYLAETEEAIDCAPCDLVLRDHPLRARYARVGGPREELRWARSVLAARGLAPAGPSVQVKTWNLSS